MNQENLSTSYIQTRLSLAVSTESFATCKYLMPQSCCYVPLSMSPTLIRDKTDDKIKYTEKGKRNKVPI